MKHAHRLQVLALLMLIALSVGCGDKKMRDRIAAMDNHTLVRIIKEYPPDSKQAILINKEIERRKLTVSPSTAVAPHIGHNPDTKEPQPLRTIEVAANQSKTQQTELPKRQEQPRDESGKTLQVLVVLIVGWVASTILCWWLAVRQGRDALVWVFLAFLFQYYAVGLLLLLPSLERRGLSLRFVSLVILTTVLLLVTTCLFIENNTTFAKVHVKQTLSLDHVTAVERTVYGVGARRDAWSEYTYNCVRDYKAEPPNERFSTVRRGSLTAGPGLPAVTEYDAEVAVSRLFDGGIIEPEDRLVGNVFVVIFAILTLVVGYGALQAGSGGGRCFSSNWGECLRGRSGTSDR